MTPYPGSPHPTFFRPHPSTTVQITISTVKKPPSNSFVLHISQSRAHVHESRNSLRCSAYDYGCCFGHQATQLQHAPHPLKLPATTLHLAWWMCLDCSMAVHCQYLWWDRANDHRQLQWLGGWNCVIEHMSWFKFQLCVYCSLSCPFCGAVIFRSYTARNNSPKVQLTCPY